LAQIRENIERAKPKSGQSVRIMAVTKTQDIATVNRAIAAGVDLLGENRVQEFLSKCAGYEQAEVHFIGGLQTNKVRQIAQYVSMVHSVDSVKLATEINSQAAKVGKVMDVLIQVNIANEGTKNGADVGALGELAEQVSEMANLRLRGLMAIPPFGDSVRYFPKMQSLYEDLRGKYEGIDTLSLGMSDDYEAAVAHGATIVRVGSALFGARSALFGARA